MAGWTCSDGDLNFWSGTLKDKYGGTIPSGAIVMWAGTLASIPAGWQLCNGANGSPDLRVKFVRGAANGAGAGAIGGTDTHTHDISAILTMAETGGTPACGCSAGDNSPANSGHQHCFPSGTCITASSLPAYYSVLFIQKT